MLNEDELLKAREIIKSSPEGEYDLKKLYKKSWPDIKNKTVTSQ